MPRKPQRGCAYPGCPRLTDGQYCDEHKRLVERQYNRYERSPISQKAYGKVWKQVRDRYVAEHPLCEMCLKEGRLTPVTEVHHIVPVTEGGTNDPENLMSLCRHHHLKVHRHSDATQGGSNPEMLIFGKRGRVAHSKQANSKHQ